MTGSIFNPVEMLDPLIGYPTIGDATRPGYILSGHVDVVSATERDWRAEHGRSCGLARALQSILPPKARFRAYMLCSRA
ncbi:hypothetical protein [Roseovarius sp. MBR-51]